MGKKERLKNSFSSEKEKESREKKKNESFKKNKKGNISFCHKPRALLITIDTIGKEGNIRENTDIKCFSGGASGKEVNFQYG